MVSQMSLLKGAIPRAGQTFHQRLILVFILFLNYFPARLSPLQLWAGIFFCKLFFFCWLFCTFLASVVCSQRHGLGSALGMLGWEQQQGRALGMLVALSAPVAAGAGCARLLLSLDFSLPSAQCCSKGVRTRSEPSVLSRPPGAPWGPRCRRPALLSRARDAEGPRALRDTGTEMTARLQETLGLFTFRCTSQGNYFQQQQVLTLFPF